VTASLVPRRPLDPQPERRPASGDLRVPPGFVAQERPPFQDGPPDPVARVLGVHGVFGDEGTERGTVRDGQGNIAFSGELRGQGDQQVLPLEDEGELFPLRDDLFHRGVPGKRETKITLLFVPHRHGVFRQEGVVFRIETDRQVMMHDRRLSKRMRRRQQQEEQADPGADRVREIRHATG